LKRIIFSSSGIFCAGCRKKPKTLSGIETERM